MADKNKHNFFRAKSKKIKFKEDSPAKEVTKKLRFKRTTSTFSIGGDSVPYKTQASLTSRIPRLKKFKVNPPKRSKQKKPSPFSSIRSKSYKNNTFNTRIRLNKTERGQLDKYQFYKEKRFLNFIAKTRQGNRLCQEKVLKKLEFLIDENKDYESERSELLNKLKSFNPLKIKEISTYLEQTEINKVLN